MDSAITTQYSSVPNSFNYGEFTFCGSFDNNAIRFLGSSSLGAPVYADLSNNNVTVTNNSLYSTSASVNVLSNVISQYMATSTTKTSGNERKKQIDRNCGQSLTSMEVLAQLQKRKKSNKENCVLQQRKQRRVALKESGQYSLETFYSHIFKLFLQQCT